MERWDFIAHIQMIMQEEGWQCKKGYSVKTCVRNQRSAINKIAKEMGIEKLTIEEVYDLGFGR